MEKKFLISSVTTGQLNAMVKNIMAQTGINDPEEVIRLINSGGLTFSSGDCWVEKNGVVYFLVVSDGTTGEEWIPKLKEKGFFVNKRERSVLLSEKFKPTKGKIYFIAVLKGSIIPRDSSNACGVRLEGKKRKLIEPNPEVACLIRYKYSNMDIANMGFCSIVVMHKPIENLQGDMSILDISPCCISSSPEICKCLWGVDMDLHLK